MKKYLISLLATAILLASCSESLDDINRNPNATEYPNPAYLLTGVEKNGADLYWGNSANYGGLLLFVQHWAAIQYTDIDRYRISNTDGIVTTPWNTGYTTLVTNLNAILSLDGAIANANYKGVALTLRSWVFLLLADLYGDIPYSEAGKSVVPVFDTQQSVYAGLQADLNEALALLNLDAGTVAGDVVYNGDIAKWRKFATSLKFRIALRTADREPEKAGEIIASLAPADLIGSNDETFRFVYTSSPYNNPQHDHFVSRNDYRISKTIVDKLKALNDPRLPVYADLPKDESVTDYAGGANGLPNDAAANQGFDRISRPGAYFISPAAPAVIYSYAEVLFNLAEAVERGYIGGNAENYYRQAVKASFDQFGITGDEAIDAYLAQPSVQYDATNWKKSIGEQKWIAFFGQGADAYAEWRRLDFPQLTAGPAGALNGEIPVRIFYPGTEQSLNGKNRETAVKRQGEDNLTTKLWFDVY
ncbi:MAG: SusD/RagB family nutrient-binding outer membrane lipoprotein [Dysgonamonadaceae bacterium]|jgi:hypothetical protein|nr:SusD/RagB family nutrient-binding outer membrane lipoprotein [Dysgonamonadaceae bacterium]